MIKIISLIFLLSITSTAEIKACSCTNVPKTFSKNIKANHIIFFGTVLEQIEIKNDSNYLMSYHGLTKIKVNKWYQNQMKSDTIYYANGQGSMCINSLEHLKIGDQVIIKSIQGSIQDPSLEFHADPDKELINLLEFYKEKPIVGYGICDVSLLKIQNQMVTGNITKNHQSRKLKLINFVKRISEKWARKLKAKLNMNQPLSQKWELDRFNKLMKMKWKAL